MKKPMLIIGILIISVLLINLTNVYANNSDESNAQLLKKAQRLYDKAIGYKSIGSNQDEMHQLFEESASIYKSLIEEKDINNAYLYYNLGNCYYHLGKLGEAIYHYKIAHQLNPAFQDITKNLNEARSSVEDYIEDKRKDSILPVLFFWHYQTPAKARLWFGAILFVLIWVLAGLNLFLRKKFVLPIIIIIAVISIVLLVSVTVQFFTEENQWWGVITESEGVDSKKGPGENYKSSFEQKLSDGIEFVVLQESGDWYKIRLKNKETCWIPKNTAKTLDHSILFD